MAIQCKFYDAKFYKETEKAVCFEVELEFELMVSSMNKGAISRKAWVWIPKSQLDKDGNPYSWIWEKNLNAKIDELNPYAKAGGLVDIRVKGVTDNPNFKAVLSPQDQAKLAQKQVKFDNAKAVRAELVAELKAKGVKGVHDRMTNNTLFSKAKSANVDYVGICLKHGYAPQGMSIADLQKKANTLKQVPPSKAIERLYLNKLQLITQKINASVKKWTVAKINANIDKNTAKQLIFEFNTLLKEWESKISDYAKNTAKKITKQSRDYVDINIKEQLKKQGVRDANEIMALKTHETSQALTAAYERNLALIKSIPSDIINRYKQGFLNATQNFDREELLRLAKTYEGISLRRAKVIARDQVSKACGDYQQSKARSLGFKHYIWVTSNDERVSQGKGGHIHLNNRIYSYDEPSAVIDSYGTHGHPSQRVNCRCSAVSVMPSMSQEFKRVKNAAQGDYFILIEKK